MKGNSWIGDKAYMMTCTKELIAHTKYVSPPGAMFIVIHQLQAIRAFGPVIEVPSYRVRSKSEERQTEATPPDQTSFNCLTNSEMS